MDSCKPRENVFEKVYNFFMMAHRFCGIIKENNFFRRYFLCPDPVVDHMVEEALAEAVVLAGADPVAALAEVPEASVEDPVDLEVLTEALADRTDLEVQDPQDPRISVLVSDQDGEAVGTDARIMAEEAVALADCSVSFLCRSSLSWCCFLLSAIAFLCCLVETDRE